VGGRAVSAGRFGGIDGDCDPSSIIDRSACSAEDGYHDASLSVSGVSKDSCPSFVRPPDANACMALSAGEYCHRHWSMENTTGKKHIVMISSGADLQESEFGKSSWLYHIMVSTYATALGMHQSVPKQC
jgi:hypothetical protein